MRLRSAALAAGSAVVLALAPLAADAQEVVASYFARGCATGVVRYEARVSVFGEVACFAGPVDFVLLRGAAGPGVDDLRLVGALTATFNPEFTGQSIRAEAGSFLFTLDVDGVPRSVNVGFGGSLFGGLAPTWTVGQTAPALFRTAQEPIRPNADYGSIRDLRGGITPFYRLPDAPLGDTGGGRRFELTFTPVPEPSTLALAAAGLVAVGVAARRKRPTA